MANPLFDESGYYIGPDFPEDCVQECSEPGRAADVYVSRWVETLQFAVPRALAVAYLKGFGAWPETVQEALEQGDDPAEALEARSDRELASIVLWLACGDIREQGEWLGVVD